MADSSSGSTTRMTFEAFETVTYTAPKAGESEIKLQLNPKEISLNYDITQNDSGNANGDSTPGMPQFNYVSPELNIETYIDNTGVLDPKTHPLETQGEGGREPSAIQKYVTKLKEVVYDFIDATHGPPFVKISWGNVDMSAANSQAQRTNNEFKGQLTKLNVTYELFSSDGYPVRAKLSMTFKAVADPATRATGQSPDLTHFHQVQIGDNLTMLSNKIYGRPDFYMQLARVNGLSSLYEMHAGERIIIPPLEKSSR